MAILCLLLELKLSFSGLWSIFSLLPRRYHAWTKKTKGKLTSEPSLASLPPTKESFTLNVKGHYQCVLWKYAVCCDPPPAVVTEFRYRRNEEEQALELVMPPSGVDLIPQQIRKMLSCNCQTDSPCGKGNCTCRNANISCSFFCQCYLNENCLNPFTSKHGKD